MHHFWHRTTALAALTNILLCTPVLADSSSAFSASSTAIGSVSTSVEKSSDSSSGKKQVAQGTYTLVAMEPLAQQPDMLRLHLVAATPQATAEISVRVARRAVNQVQLEVGQSITAEHRPYGLALAKVTKGSGASPFFLILADDWFNELESRPVVL